MAEREYFEQAKQVIDDAGFELSEVREFMDDLRDGGSTNMMGTGPDLQSNFGFTRFDVKPIVLDYLHHGLRDDDDDPDEIPMTVSRGELATILAALRTYQEAGYGDPDRRPDAIHEIAAGDLWTSLDDAGIDDLCERINCGG